MLACEPTFCWAIGEQRFFTAVTNIARILIAMPKASSLRAIAGSDEDKCPKHHDGFGHISNVMAA